MKYMKWERNRKRGKLLKQRGDLRRTNGGSGGGVWGRGGCRWIEEFTVKGVGAFALVDGDPRRLTESRKMASHPINL